MSRIDWDILVVICIQFNLMVGPTQAVAQDQFGVGFIIACQHQKL